MKKINYKFVMKSLLVIGLLFSLVTPAFAIEDSNVNNNPTAEQKVDNINPNTAQFDKAKPTDLSYVISIVERGANIEKLEIDNVSIGGEGYSLNLSTTVSEGYHTAFDLTLKKEFLNNLSLGEHTFNATYANGKVLSAKIDVINSEKCTISFSFSPVNSGYVEYTNSTTGHYDITDGTGFEVNRGDTISVCAYGKPGYFNYASYRNGVDTLSNCDDVVVEEDLNYSFSNITYDHGVSIAPTDVDFAEQKVGYAPISEKEITFKNTTSESYQVNVSQPENFDISEVKCELGLNFDGDIMLFNGTVCKFTVKPKDGLPAGEYNEKIEILDRVFKPEVDPNSNLNLTYVPEDYEALASLNVNFVVESDEVITPDTGNDDKPNIDKPDVDDQPTVTPGQDDNTKPSETPKVDVDKDSVPQTGDSSHILMYGTISVSTLAVVIYLHKKHKTNS